jgi:hypothetical protein
MSEIFESEYAIGFDSVYEDKPMSKSVAQQDIAFRRLVATENRLRDKRWCQLFRLVSSAADANGILVWGYTNDLGFRFDQ